MATARLLTLLLEPAQRTFRFHALNTDEKSATRGIVYTPSLSLGDSSIQDPDFHWVTRDSFDGMLVPIPKDHVAICHMLTDRHPS